jgi:hypothetical protein
LHGQHERNLNALEKALRDKYFGPVFYPRPTAGNLLQKRAIFIIRAINSDFQLTGAV